MNEKAPGLGQQETFLRLSSIIRPMRYLNVPPIDWRYWISMTLASILGCNTGDDCAFFIGWNHWIGLAPLALVFAGLTFGEHRSTRSTQAWYWSVVIVLRTAATNVADLLTHTFSWPYPWVILGLTIIQVVVILLVAPRLIAVGNGGAGRPATDGWYWLCLFTAGTLGTAIGDWVAEELHFGTGLGSLVLGAVFALALVVGARVQWSTKAAYWLPVIAVRAAGTTAGDWLAFREDPGLNNGLHLGLPLSTAIAAVLFVASLIVARGVLNDHRLS